jgi:hypothetical protein
MENEQKPDIDYDALILETSKKLVAAVMSHHQRNSESPLVQHYLQPDTTSAAFMAGREGRGQVLAGLMYQAMQTGGINPSGQAASIAAHIGSLGGQALRRRLYKTQLIPLFRAE